MYGVAAFRAVEVVGSEELSTRIRVLSDGTVGDEIVRESRSGMRCWRSGRLERGGLRERLASVLMIKCEAER